MTWSPATPLKKVLQQLSQSPTKKTRTQNKDQKTIPTEPEKRKHGVSAPQVKDFPTLKFKKDQGRRTIQSQQQREIHTKDQGRKTIQSKERDVLFDVRGRRRGKGRLQEGRIPCGETWRSVCWRTIHCAEEAWMGQFLHHLARFRHRFLCMFSLALLFPSFLKWVCENSTSSYRKMSVFPTVSVCFSLFLIWVIVL